jgi:hypothetical protein
MTIDIIGSGNCKLDISRSSEETIILAAASKAGTKLKRSNVKNIPLSLLQWWPLTSLTL